MSRNKLDKLSSGREFVQYARDQADEQLVKIYKNGSYICIENERGKAYIPDSARAMPKQSRSLIVTAFRIMGLVGIVMAVLFVLNIF